MSPRESDAELGGGAHPTVRVAAGDLAEGDTRMFDFERDGEDLEAFVIRHEGQLKCYVNRCPHVTYSLDVGDGDVKDKTGKFLLCASHGAMFLPESGECFMGTVVGRSLESLPVDADGDDAVVTITPEPEGWPEERSVVPPPISLTLPD